MVEEQTLVVDQSQAPREETAKALDGAKPELTKEPETDWKAETAKERTGRERAEKDAEDFRSRYIAGLKQDERDSLLAETHESLKVIAAAFASGEADKIPDALKAIEEKHKRQAELSTKLQQEDKEFVAEFTEVAAQLGYDNPNDVPEFKSAVSLNYTQFRKTGDPWYLTQAQREAHKITRKLLTAQKDKDVQTAVKQAKAEAAMELEKTKRDLGVLAEPVGGAGAGAGGITKATKDNIDALFVKFEREHPREHNPYENGYREFLATGKV